MGSIRKKEKVINGKAYTYYEARYTVGIDPGTGKQIQKSISGKTQREVTRRLKEITTSIDTGTYLPSCKLTVGEWLNTWISEYTADWKPLTVSNYSKQIKKHLIPRLALQNWRIWTHIQFSCSITPLRTQDWHRKQ